jgi:GNAT superfamily N-acetyltransferase
MSAHVDEAFLARMLVEAVFWDPDMKRQSVDEVLARPELARYVRGWGRAGDDALAALTLDDVPVGAAWVRLFDASEPGYGFVDAATPELSIAVERDHQGRGAGSLMLAGVLGRARARGVERVSLSVGNENPARSMYERFGFAKIAETAETWTMLIDLTK